MAIHNFYAGPSIIDASILETASNAIRSREDLLSVIEISHRSVRFGEIMEEARSLVRELAQLDDDFEVLFLQGGGRQQFFQVPFNLLNFNQVAYYINTGSWAKQAMHEASFFGKAEAIASSESTNFNFIPKSAPVPENAAYLHITTNNTIYGTQFHDIPSVDAPLVADMSSDIFCRPLDYNRFGLVYAATQKNAGTAGATIVMVRKSILKKAPGSIPTMVDYQTHIKKQSLYNTPPTFAVYMSLLTLRWLKASGGLSHFVQHNEAKSNAIYAEIDRNSMFVGHALKEDRSVMNAVFTFTPEVNQVRENDFVAFCEARNIIGLKGHSSVGGFRASMYNALPLESVNALVDTMQDFEKQFG